MELFFELFIIYNQVDIFDLCVILGVISFVKWNIYYVNIKQIVYGFGFNIYLILVICSVKMVDELKEVIVLLIEYGELSYIFIKDSVFIFLQF